MTRGLDQKLASMTAFRPQGPWRLSQSKAMHVAFPTAYFDSLGLEDWGLSGFPNAILGPFWVLRG